MFFEIAGIEVHPLIPPLVAFLISLLTSMGGVSGAFLILPFQMTVLGYTAPSVSATNQLFNIVAIPSGVIRYIREGRMVWPLTWIVIIGTLPGVFIGALIRINYLPDPTHFKVFAGIVLAYIAARMIADIAGKRKSAKPDSEKKFNELVRRSKKSGEALPRTKIIKFSIRTLIYEFFGEEYSVPVLMMTFISFVVGILGGIYGVGGGAIIAPIFVAFFGLPVYTIAGAALMGTFVTSIAGVGFYQFLSAYYPGMSIAPDWLLGILFGIGGMAGMYAGAYLQKYVPAKAIKIILAAAIFFVAGRYILQIFF